ncbi:RICIN domain-containing protein [Streptomyces phaeochromogenes]
MAVPPTSDGYHQVVNPDNGKAWDGDSGATDGGIRGRLWDRAGGTHQQWCPQAPGTGRQYRFVARHSGKCPAVDGSSAADGARLSQQSCSGASAQALALTG